MAETDTVRWHDYWFWIAEHPINGNWLLWVDLFLLDAVIRPALDANGMTDFKWLIHRRARADDDDRHCFKFSCRCSPQKAGELNVAIQSSEHYTTHYVQVFSKQASHHKGPYGFTEGEKRFDRGENWWPSELRNSWTHFICGVSRAVLDVINDTKASLIATSFSLDAEDTASVAKLYESINSRIERNWMGFGQPVFLHHLNALFGYGPVAIQPRSQNGNLLSF